MNGVRTSLLIAALNGAHMVADATRATTLEITPRITAASHQPAVSEGEHS
jgi:hypothetical protein